MWLLPEMSKLPVPTRLTLAPEMSIEAPASRRALAVSTLNVPVKALLLASRMSVEPPAMSKVPEPVMVELSVRVPELTSVRVKEAIATVVPTSPVRLLICSLLPSCSVPDST